MQLLALSAITTGFILEADSKIDEEYTFAVSVALERMTSRNHWASDTIVGGALGYWVGGMLVKKQSTASKGSQLNFYPAGNRFSVVMNF